ncbi:MAG TPA: protein kinase [Chthoniobacteraceae bacterium]|jgi:tetratricopeptide (TPR) repeat protein|nr:protein kinase [Chthoniobacteraceae bacterium]
MSELYEPITQECAACGALIDITDEEPLGLMHCPGCGVAMRVHRCFGNFEPVEVLGAGGMGAVYRAQDISLNRSVALKLLRREYSEHPEITKQFEHEAAVTALINHPNVVKVFSTGTDHGVFYIAMELVDKGSLDDLMTLQGKVGEAQVLEVGIQVAQGLRAAYRQGLIHRDIKPGNILFAQAHHAKMVDFGLAAPITDAGEVAGEVWGTPYYVAPEKLDRPPMEDFRSDIYSLGATLFHALAGRPPYEATDASMVALKHLKSQPVSLAAFAPEVSTRTAFVINKTLSKEPGDRQQSYDELIEQLEYARNELLTKVAVRSQKVRRASRVVVGDQGNQTALSVITVIMLLLLGVGGYFVYQNRERIFPKNELDSVGMTPGQQALQAKLKEKPRYEDARRLMVQSKSPEEAQKAAADFRKLEAEGKLVQPMLNWTTLHAGLASLIAGDLDGAKADFEKLAKREPISQDPVDLKMSEFFKTVATEMAKDDPPSVEIGTLFSRENYECIGPLIFALKSWEMGEFDNAIKLFGEFDRSRPEDPDTWVADYKTLAEAYPKNFENYREFNDMTKTLTNPEKIKDQLPKLEQTLAGLTLRGALAKKGKSTIRRLKQEVSDFEEAKAKEEADMFASDTDTLKEAEKAVIPLVAQYKFDEARASVEKVQVITDKGKAKKKDTVNKYEWLNSFKSTLTGDVGTAPYNGAVARKVGVPVTGSVTDTNDTGVVMKVGAATVTIPWNDVSIDSLIAIAQTYCKADLPADRLGDRLWLIGVFAAVEGKLPEATKYFGLAIAKKASYKVELKVFPEVPPPGA